MAPKWLGLWGWARRLVQRQLLGMALVLQALLRCAVLQRRPRLVGWPRHQKTRQTSARVALGPGHGVQPLDGVAVHVSRRARCVAAQAASGTALQQHAFSYSAEARGVVPAQRWRGLPATACCALREEQPSPCSARRSSRPFVEREFVPLFWSAVLMPFD